MIERNIIARSHFTRNVDGKEAFNQFLTDCGLLREGLRYEYQEYGRDGQDDRKWLAQSWGGYMNADNRWMIFVSWRSTKGGYVRYVRWFWDSDNQRPYGQRVDTWY